MKFRVIVEFKVQRHVMIYDASDADEASELALEEIQNAPDTLGVEDYEIVDIIEEG